MSTLRVNKISNLTGDGPVEFSTGIQLPPEKSINGNFIINAGIVTSQSLVTNNMTLSGIVSASSFVGSGIGITGIPGTPIAKSFSFNLIS